MKRKLDYFFKISVSVLFLSLSFCFCYFFFKNYYSILLKFGIYPVYRCDAETEHTFKGRLIGFLGDSITFGHNDDKPGAQLDSVWTKEIPGLLGCDVVNCGVNSASVIGGRWPPKVWSRDFEEIPVKIDILGVMIGINDCFRGDHLGHMEDRCDTTFYGGLHILLKGLTQKFPIHEKKHIFLIIYPHYDGKDTFSEFTKAMYEVADFYSVPVCDLSLILGASPYNDETYLYWRRVRSTELHSPHPTAIISHSYATAIANFINSHFLIE